MEPTVQLRFVRRVMPNPRDTSLTIERLILQQKWIEVDEPGRLNLSSEEWRDVPVEEE